jgi:hypothetical protein
VRSLIHAYPSSSGVAHTRVETPCKPCPCPPPLPTRNPRHISYLTSSPSACFPTRFKTHNTPASLAELTDTKLGRLGVHDKNHRELTLAAIKKLIAGHSRTSTNTSAGVAISASGNPADGAAGFNGASATAVCSLACLFALIPSKCFDMIHCLSDCPALLTH